MRNRGTTSFLTGVVAAALAGCADPGLEGPNLSRARQLPTLDVGEARPRLAEKDAAGALTGRITRDGARFSQLVRNDSELIQFKDEEGTGADRLMAPRLRGRLLYLDQLVTQEWPGLHLRVTEAWDENGEHSGLSLHYEGRAADLTTSDRDPGKLGRLGALAVDAGFAWVFRERTHVHASVR